MAGMAAFLGILLASIPFIMEFVRKEADFVTDIPFVPSPLAAIPGILLILAAGTLIYASLKKQLLNGVITASAVMGLFAVASYQFLMPLNEYYNQRPRLELMNYAYKNNGELILYKDISFAVMYYGDRTVKVLHNYKFKGDLRILTQRHPQDQYILTRTASEHDLESNYPLAEKVKRLGNHSLYVIRSEKQVPK